MRWLTVFIDRPAAAWPAVANFWAAVTGTTPSAARGDREQFTTLLPPAGDAHLRMQQVMGGPGGSHLDVHTDEPRRLVEVALGLGASLVEDDPVHVLRSPGGFAWCAVGWYGETAPSPPVTGPSGAPARVDQLCLDIAPGHFDAEVRFWSALLDSPATASTSRPEFVSLARSPGTALRLLLQRCAQGDGPSQGHLDLAAGTRVDDVVADHVAAGAVVESRDFPWTVLRDPSGHRYCITPREPFP